MPDHGRRSPARLFAPLALILTAVALIGVVLISAGGDDGGDPGDSAQRSSSEARTTTTPPRPRRRNYTVKTGDTLGAIAERTGITVERLQELNPELDPQALVSGQRIKLRE